MVEIFSVLICHGVVLGAGAEGLAVLQLSFSNTAYKRESGFLLYIGINFNFCSMRKQIILVKKL